MFDDWDTHIVPFSFPDMKYSAIPLLTALLTVSGLHASPPQYLSQLHTEILGRLPSAEEWNRYEKGFATENFEIPSAEGVAIAFFGSQEWRNLKYSSVETSYVLYRSLLLREPSTEEMRLLSAQVERSGGNLSGIVKDLVRSQEFKDRVNGMIARPNGHGYFANRPSHRPSLGSTGQGNGYLADLQAALNQTPAGGTFYLAQGALIELDGTLEVPANVTLATFDSTSASKLFQKPNQYAKMARIVRANVFDGELVRLQPGSRLVGVWVDGRRSQLRTDDPSLLVANASSSARNTNAVNIVLVSSPSGDTPTEIIACKISDSSGWTNILTRGSDGAWAPGAARITRNIITCYSANRDLVESFFTDGISSTASDAHITENAIVDPSDVGIVVFNPWMPSRQNSQIVGNDIFFAGNNGWGGITLDHNAGSECLCTSSPLDCGAPKVDCRNALDESITCDFSNTLVSDNTIRSSKYAYANVGISVGVHLWGLPMYGRGSQVVSNRVGLPSMPLVSAIGIVIAHLADRPLTVANLYLPKGGLPAELQRPGSMREQPDGGAKYARKMGFLAGFARELQRNRLAAQRAGREFLLVGDLNVAHLEHDVTNWRPARKMEGFLPEEREWFGSIIGSRRLVDVVRALHGDRPGPLTWWSWAGESFTKDVGWRIDHQLATPGLARRALEVAVDKESSPDARLSDHAPLIVRYAD